MSSWVLGLAWACSIWYFFILLVTAIGFFQLYRHYSSKPEPAISPRLDLEEVPHITILRPVKGLEPQLYECLAATFRQEYPIEKLTIYLCIDSVHDTAYPVLQRLVADFPHFDAKIFVAEEDPNLGGHGGASHNLGPNPKIRNMSRGYREAKGDLMWIMDCNVWVAPGVAGRMVDKLCGFSPDGNVTPYKFVHQLPFVIDSVGSSANEETRGLLNRHTEEEHQVSSTSSAAYHISSLPTDESLLGTILRIGGGRLEEMFMSSAHAKFYTAINTVAVAPCIVGKSNMFRRSHLNFLTSTTPSPYSPGIDFFSSNIVEDHLIGEILWRKKVPEEISGQRFHKHGLVLGDLAIQPMSGMAVREYLARRVRWLRVRKWTVPLATLVEPGTESLLCSLYASFALTTLPWSNTYLGIPHTWLAFCVCWFINVLAWMCLDCALYNKLHSRASVETDEFTPQFVESEKGKPQRPFVQWIMAWLGREVLALPIWTWAVLGGTAVVWRGRRFRVGMDAIVREIGGERGTASPDANGRSRSKDRVD